ncbi:MULTISPECIES: hypothetical protein [unclassified Psychrobacillus]|uniref:hypothetical protein n=1 Tax=unclassified Psychrobacillus TaxID=2636677 RepID=UPI0030FC3897
MERRKYYVVELEFFKGNFRHKAIFHSEGTRYGKEYGKLFSSGYESPRTVDIEELHYFQVISEIHDMNI